VHPVNYRRRRKVERWWKLLLLLLLLLEHALERSLDHVDERAKSAEERAEAEAPALDTDGVDEEVNLESMLVAC
jgi:hypothetical protein